MTSTRPQPLATRTIHDTCIVSAPAMFVCIPKIYDDKMTKTRHVVGPLNLALLHASAPRSLSRKDRGW